MLIGQERAASVLSRALAQGRVSHAYLFVGPEGAGKTTAAILFAQALNCEQRATESLGCLCPCGQCESCRRIEAGTHPDVHVIAPGSKGGQNISVEQMRDVRQDVARRPITGRRKVYLIPTAEAMNEEAANTLLKTLEEPPEYVTLVLMATSPTRVLPTVLSRCQVVPFGRVPAESIQSWLEGKDVARATAASLALRAGGRPGLALRWSQEPESLERQRRILELLEEITALRRLARDRPAEGLAAFRMAEQARRLVGPEESDGAGGSPSTARGGGEEAAPVGRTGAKPLFIRMVELIRGYYRDLLLLSQGAPESLLWNGDRLAGLRSAAEQYTPAELLAMLQAVDRCQQFLERNVAPQLALETLFLELLQPEASATATGSGVSR